MDGPESVMATLTPGLLSMMGRELIRRGEWLGLIEVKNGVPIIYPVAYVTVNGGYDPDSWTYELTLAGPDRTSTLYSVGAERVIHIRYAQDPERPWRGVGPIQAAALAGRLSAETLEALGDEASGPRGLIPTHARKDGQDDTLTLMRADVRKAKGSMLFVESMADAFQSGAERSPQDWQAKRFGAMVPDAMVDMSSMVTREIVSACGVSPTLFDPKSSAAMREAWRQLLFGTVAPLGRIVAAELSAKLFPLTLEWQELRASDLQGRARAVQSLTAAGVDQEKALEMAGLTI